MVTVQPLYCILRPILYLKLSSDLTYELWCLTRCHRLPILALDEYVLPKLVNPITRYVCSQRCMRAGPLVSMFRGWGKFSF